MPIEHLVERFMDPSGVRYSLVQFTDGEVHRFVELDGKHAEFKPVQSTRQSERDKRMRTLMQGIDSVRPRRGRRTWQPPHLP